MAAHQQQCSDCKLSDSAGQILERLGRIDEGMNGINRRLDILNGSVAKHEKAIGDMRETEAERRGADRTLSAAVKFVAPALWATAGICVLLLLQNSAKVLAAIGAAR
jgi:hypothetical protein